MFAGPIPTATGNSRIAALNARKRPQVDVNDYGIAVQAGGGQTPMLTNRTESLDSGAMSRVQQRGFGSGREAIGEAIDAGGRTYRTDRLQANYEIADEEREMERKMTEADELHKARTGAAVKALTTRNDAQLYFDPAVSRVRESELADKAALYESQSAGKIAEAEADIYGADVDAQIAETRAKADVAESRLGGGSRALAALAAMRNGLQDPVKAASPIIPNWVPVIGGWGGREASDPDAALRQQFDTEAQNILRGLSFDQAGNQNGQQPGPDGQQQTMAAPAGPQQPDQAAVVRNLMIQTFAQQQGIPPADAERILRQHRKIQ